MLPFAAVVLLISCVSIGDALTCECNNGRVVKSTPQCICECTAGYQLPDCNYKNTEDVRIDIYINDTSENFRSTVFMNETANALTISVNSMTYRYAVELERFGKTNVLLVMPGYAVVRFIPLVEAQVPWVRRLKIESAYVIPIPAAPPSVISAYPVFNYNGYQLTVEGMMFFMAFVCVLFVGWFIEFCCCFKNTEDVIGELGYKPADADNLKNVGPAHPKAISKRPASPPPPMPGTTEPPRSPQYPAQQQQPPHQYPDSPRAQSPAPQPHHV